MTEVFINSQWINITTTNNTLKGSTPGSEDKDPALQNLLNSVYYTESGHGFSFSNPPTMAELEMFAQGINNISAYFTQNGTPDPIANPNAYGIYSALNSIPVGLTESPAQLCADLMGSDPTKSGAAFQELTSSAGTYFVQTTFGQEVLNNWFHGPNEDHASSQFNQAGNTSISNDLTDMQNDIAKYNADLKNGASQHTINLDLQQIASDMVAFSTDSVPTSGSEDGYLQAMTEFLGSASDPTSFLSLATAVYNDPSTANCQALQTALTNINETGKTTGDLTGILSFVIWGEY